MFLFKFLLAGAGHLTKDCRAEPGDAMNMAAMMDDEYSALMQELGEKPMMSKPVDGNAPPAMPPANPGRRVVAPTCLRR